MMVDALSREAELEDATDVLLLTPSDDFNAVAAADLRRELGHGHVYRVAPEPEISALLPPAAEIGILGSPALTFLELSRRFDGGAHIVERSGQDLASVDGEVPLFVVGADGRLSVAHDGRPPRARPGERLLVLVQP
jgi:hypothetical protein